MFNFLSNLSTCDQRERKVAIAYIGLGSNLGRKKANIRRAVKLLSTNKDIKILKISSLYETEPVGYV
ncbi:2-amino-4-hydroxy-6-hydroxymethyldihydropteridine diphosphokinase, partial [bacterium]|nr:2-amino-4-hydroxy-6-hydroxymethyldihydropteridine diphosphokinase [bacterium]